MAMVASRRRLPSVVSAGAVLLLATAAWWPPTTAHAEDATVAVQSTAEGGRYVPDEITIELGDTVTWVWETDGHSVTHEPEDGQEPVFDSHPNGGEDPSLCPPFCGEDGATFTVTDFPEPGRYAYTSKMDPRMRGVVVVTEPAPSPSPTPPTASSPSDPSPTATSEPEPSPEHPTTTSEATPEPEREPPPPAPEPEPEPEQRVAAPQPVERTSASEAPTVGAPAVADDDETPSPVPEPSFEDFPSASEPTDDVGVDGDVALGGPGDGAGPERTVWAVVAGASVLGTLGTFGRTVLFGDTWNA